MKDQNKQQEMQALEEACLDLVTGAGDTGSSNGQPWNYPFDSGSAPVTHGLITADPGVDPKRAAQQLDKLNNSAIRNKSESFIGEGLKNVHLHSDGTHTITYHNGHVVPRIVPKK